MTDPRCRGGKSCAARTSDGAALVSQANTLCHACITDIQKRLDELPHLIGVLNTLKGNWGGVSYEARVQSSKEPPTPLHVGIVDMVDEIGDAIDGADGHTVVDLVTQPAEVWYIGGRKVERDGVHRALDIRRVHEKASDMAGLNRVWQRRAAACPECHLPTLGTWVGEENISCSNGECLATFTRSEYEDHCINTSRNEKRK